jgi:TonB family protein
VGCLVLGVAALALSNFNFARATGLLYADARTDLAAPANTMTADLVTGVTGASSQAGGLDPTLMPDLSSSAADHASLNASQPARPEVPISRPVPAPSDRPVQRPPAAAMNNHQSLAMTLRRPRVATPRPPLAALPAPAVGEIVVPPIASMDPPPFETRLPEMPQPMRPPEGTTYHQPELIARVEPVYSRFAREARMQGNVQISATIGADGLPRFLTRVSGNSALADMAIEAVRQWRYQPALLNGQPTETHTVITFNFQLR